MNGKPPLVLNTSEFFVYFHSDGSVEDWGYKFTATAYFPKRLTNPTKTHWMIRTDFELVDFLCSFAALLVEGPSVNLELENSLYTEWIESGSLIKSELFEGVERASEEDSFLYDLIDRPVGTLADAFANRMKAVVQEDQGTIGTINRAVYGCCAVLIKYRNLASEATALAKGLRKEPSSTLIKAWKYGQKMRSYFDLQDLRKAISSIGAMPSPESTEHIPTPRTPSSVGDSAGSSASSGRANANSKASLTIYSGADLMVLEAASRSVVERVKFLLRSTLSTSNSGFDQVMETDAEQTPEKDNVSPLKELDVLVGTGNKWKLSTKLIQMQRQVSDETQNAAEVWQALVTEAMVADKLRNMLEHRRRFAEKSQKKGVLSLTEKVLKFIQSDIEIHKLEELNSLRNKRAIYRAKGMDVFASIFKTISVPFETVIATNSYISVIQRISSRENTDSSHIANRNYHYMTGVDGCSLAQASLLSQKYSVVLTALVKLMVMSNDKFQESSKQCLQLVGQNGHDLVTTDVVTKKKEMESYERDTIAVIRACSMDYDTVDHAIIAESGLFEAISTLLSSDSKRISTVVESLLEILVARCLIVDGGKNDTLVENTDLSSKIIALLSERVQSDTRLLIGEISAEGSSDVANAHAGAFNNNDSESKSINPPFEYCMVPKTLNLRRYSTGYSHRHIDLASQHSFSLWIKRPKCEKLDSAIERLEAGATIEEIFSVGQEVVKCAEVSINHKVDGGYGSIGRVCSIIGDKDKLVVQWETTGVKENYYFSASQRDVVPADYEVGGHIFGKGAPKIVFDWTDGAPLPWSLMGLQLLPDATLLSYLSSASVPETESKNMVLLNRSKQIVKADTWTHVTVTVDRNSSLKMYINGVLDSEITMANPCSAIDKAVSTSKVFVLNSEITFPVKYFVDFTGANECVCTFSGLKDLPKNVLKIQFYDDIACERVCHAKYVRGFVSENSSLVSSITSDFFKLNKNDNTLKVFSGRFFAKIDIDSSNIKDDALAKLNIICSITGNSNSLDNVAIPQTESKTGINISKIANDIPFYLGQVPCYVMDSDNSLVSKGFNGSIARLIVHPLTAISEDVVKKYAEMSVDSESGKIVDSTNNSTTSAKFTSGNSNYLSILSMYSIIRRGLDNLENLYDTSIKRDFSNTKLLDSIFSLMGSSSSIVQAATFRMSCHIIPYLEITLVDYSAMKSGLSKGYDSFLHYLVATAGQSLNVWCKRQRAQASCAQQIQEIGQYQYDITMSKLELVRAFSAGSQDWKIFLAEFLSNGIALVKPVLKILQETVQLELDNSNEQFVQESYLYSNHNDGIFESKDDKATLIASVDLLYGMLAVLGGDYSTLYAGSVALYIDDQGMVEDCLVLGQTYPPLFDMENEKDKAKAWEKATFTSSVDDAVAIMLFSQPNVVVSAARSQLKPIESYSSYVSTKFDPNSSKVVNIHKFIKENIGTEKLMQLFTFINLATISDTRPVLRSKIEQQFVTKTFESDHPYHDSVNSYETVSFPGAESIMLEFDERCATEIDTDYVKFYRDEKHSTYYGREGGYSGRDYQRHWPGIDGVPPLIIPASSFVLNFHTDDSGNVSDNLF